MNIKEEIENRLKAGFNKKEITTFLKSKGYTESEIEKEFPKLERNNRLYIFVLIVSILMSLSTLTLIFIFGNILSPIGIILLTLCFGTYLIYRLKKAGFIIHIIFYVLLIFSWFLGHTYYSEGALLSPLFSFKYFVPLMIIFSFMIRSLYKLFKKV